MSFSYNWIDLADVNGAHLNAQPALGGMGLNFGIAFSKRDVSETLGRVDIGPMQLTITAEPLAGGVATLLGNAQAPASTNLTFNGIATTDTVTFALLLPQEQLGALEEFRNGDGLKFRLELSALAMGRHGPWAMHAQAHIEANLSRWLELLQMGRAAEYITVSLKLPSLGEADPLSPALAKLRSAQALLLQGEYDAAAAACRVSLETIQAAQGRPTQKVMDMYRDGHRLMNRQHRLDLLQMAAYHLTNLSVHHAEGGASVLGRSDAALLVATVAGLLQSSVARRATEVD